MTGAYIGEIRRFGGAFVPEGWLPCDGRFLNADEYAELFALIGTRFGGTEGRFALPNLNEIAASTNGVVYLIATAGRIPVEPQLQVEL